MSLLWPSGTIVGCRAAGLPVGLVIGAVLTAMAVLGMVSANLTMMSLDRGLSRAVLQRWPFWLTGAETGGPMRGARRCPNSRVSSGGVWAIFFEGA